MIAEAPSYTIHQKIFLNKIQPLSRKEYKKECEAQQDYSNQRKHFITWREHTQGEWNYPLFKRFWTGSEEKMRDRHITL
jgi:hypothetical protein